MSARLLSFSKWCGNAEDQEEPLSERVLDFVVHKWRNRAYQSLARSVICIRGFDFCKPEHEVISSFFQFGFWFYGWWLLIPAVGATPHCHRLFRLHCGALQLTL